MRIVFALILLSPASLISQEKKESVMPPGVMPSMIVLQSVDKEKRTVTYFDVRTRMTSQTRTQVVNENGVFKMVTITVQVPVSEFILASIDLRESRIFDAGGKLLTIDVALKRLGPGQAMVLSSDHNMIHPLYARLLRDDVIVLTRNPSHIIAPPAPK